MNANNQLNFIDHLMTLSIGDTLALNTAKPITVNYIIGEDHTLVGEAGVAEHLFVKVMEDENSIYQLPCWQSDDTVFTTDISIVKLTAVDCKGVRLKLNNDLEVITNSTNLLGSLTSGMIKLREVMAKDFESLYHRLPGNVNVRHLTQTSVYEEKYVPIETMLTREGKPVYLFSNFQIHTDTEAYLSTDGQCVAVGVGTKHIYFTSDGKHVHYSNEPLPEDVIRTNFGQDSLTFVMDGVEYNMFSECQFQF